MSKMTQKDRIELMLIAILGEHGCYPSFDDKKKTCKLERLPVKKQPE